MNVTFFDAGVLITVALGGFLGYRYGPLKMFFALLALLVALILGFRAMGPLGRGIQSIGLLAQPSAAVLVFIAALILVLASLVILIRKFGKPTAAKKGGRVGAAFLGGVGMVLLLSAVFLVLKLVGVPGASTRTNSLFYRPIVNVLPMTFDSLRHAFPDESEMEEESSGGRRFGS